METPKVFESEYRFCLILWEHEPVRSSELVALCRERLGWKPTTTYTVIKRLAERVIDFSRVSLSAVGRVSAEERYRELLRQGEN